MGFGSYGSWTQTQTQSTDSIAVAHGFSCSKACGIFPDQGSNLCSLHWQADSYPLRHQGSVIALITTAKSLLLQKGTWPKVLRIRMWASSRVVLVVKNLPDNARDIRDAGSISGSERSPRRRNGNPLQYSCLENSMDRGDRWATVHRTVKSWV